MKASQIFNCGELLIRYALTSTSNIGFIVSKKYGSSVDRNLFKRRCRFVFKYIFIDNNTLVSIIVKPKSQNISYKSIFNSFSLIHDKVSI